MYGTNTVQGVVEIKPTRVHGGMFNCIVIPDDSPEEWFFKQFPTKEMIFEWALEHNFSVREEV